MSSATKIVFDEIHTLEKQQFLSQKMLDVANQIHERFPKNNRIEKCPCCSSADHAFFTEKFGFPFDLCQACKHIFTNPMPRDEALNYYYNSELKTFENKFFNESRDARVKIFTHRLSAILENTIGTQLLDIGSAVGIFLDANRLEGSPFKITSCDISKEACSFVELNYREVRVIHSDVMLLQENEQFDCITLWDTLEHIVNPVELLTKLRHLLSNNGVLCFSTPNTDSFEWQIMGADHVQLLPPGHVNLYNTKNIEILLRASGFRVHVLSTPNATLDVSYIKKVLDKGSATQTTTPHNKIEALKSILASAFWESEQVEGAVIDYLKQHKKAGNMFVIAKK